LQKNKQQKEETAHFSVVHLALGRRKETGPHRMQAALIRGRAERGKGKKKETMLEKEGKHNLFVLSEEKKKKKRGKRITPSEKEENVGHELSQ